MDPNLVKDAKKYKDTMREHGYLTEVCALYDEYKELVKTLNYHCERYYHDDEAEISDFEYDMLNKKLKEIEAAHPEMISPDSPSQRVGWKATKGVLVQHRVPMLSLQDVFSKEDVDEFVNTVYLLSGSFGGINLEDISAPRCFEIEKRLQQICDVPVFHDDQHGTAIVTLAGLTNALKVVNKKIEEITVVVSGAGAAAIAITKLLLSAGIKEAIICDRKGAVYEGREGLNWVKSEMAQITNKNKVAGSLADVIKGADVFVGVSGPGVLTKEMVATMAKDAIIFACANPTPEIFPEEAKAGGARVVATGRSDYPNQVNNVLAFPGIFRGAFDVRAKDINDEMKLAAAQAIAGLISEDEVNEDYVIPSVLDPRVAKAVATAVAAAARKSGVARI